MTSYPNNTHIFFAFTSTKTTRTMVSAPRASRIRHVARIVPHIPMVRRKFTSMHGCNMMPWAVFTNIMSTPNGPS